MRNGECRKQEKKHDSQQEKAQMKQSHKIALILGGILACVFVGMALWLPLPINLEESFWDGHNSSTQRAEERMLQEAQRASDLRFGPGNYRLRYNANVYNRGGWNIDSFHSTELIGDVPVQVEDTNYIYIVHFTRTLTGIHSHGQWKTLSSSLVDNSLTP